ncbi:MAG TPA: glycosyltransferase, partial [Acidimicrobiia bacterium]|nr:glycosyltransferase [Acidimicrobiia bacterium]
TNVAAATRVVVPSQCSRVDVLRAYGCAADKVHCVPYGVDLDVFTPDARLHPSIAALANPYAMFVGTVHPRKNLPLLRAAMAQLTRRVPVAPTFVLVLTAVLSPDGKRLEAEATAPVPGLQVVRVPSPTDADLAALLARAAVLCLPSAWEGFGFPALEAMACGTPVVVTDRGALPELVGDAGSIVEPDVEALAAAIEEMLRDPPPPDRGRRRAEQFSWSRTIDGWEAVLQETAHADTPRVLR